jgi:hypothetical protein
VPVIDAHTVAAALPQANLRIFPRDLHEVNEHDRDTVHGVVAAFLGAVIAQRTPLAS